MISLFAMSLASAAPVPEPPAVAQGQRVLTHASLATFLHPEVPGNLPLKVSVPPLLAPGAAGWVVGGQPVLVVPAAEARLRLDSAAAVGAEKLLVSWSVPAEGASGTLVLAFRDGAWSVTEADAHER